MGTLVAAKYPTRLFLRVFDHTYVQCSTGAVRWRCWGGTSGGASFKTGTGSTIRADTIANDGNAGIACYLINGVCHQAANRILLAGNATAAGARGYWVSTALYGVYGRPAGFGKTCPSPFEQHVGVTGDMPLCVSNSPVSAELDTDVRNQDGPHHREFLAASRNIYAEFERRESLNHDEVIRLQLLLFAELVNFRFSEFHLSESDYLNLLNIRLMAEHARIPLDEQMCTREIGTDEFVAAYNDLIVRFQVEVQNLLDADQYTTLFDLAPGDTVAFGDPEIAREAYAPDFDNNPGGGLAAGA